MCFSSQSVICRTAVVLQRPNSESTLTKMLYTRQHKTQKLAHSLDQRMHFHIRSVSSTVSTTIQDLELHSQAYYNKVAPNTKITLLGIISYIHYRYIFITCWYSQAFFFTSLYPCSLHWCSFVSQVKNFIAVQINLQLSCTSGYHVIS